MLRCLKLCQLVGLFIINDPEIKTYMEVHFLTLVCVYKLAASFPTSLRRISELFSNIASTVIASLVTSNYSVMRAYYSHKFLICNNSFAGIIPDILLKS